MAKTKKDEVVVEELPKEDNKKQRALDLAIASIENKFGKGSIMTLSGYQDTEPVKHISSGSIALDIILGRGGFCFGRIVEMFGENGCGKTTLCLSIIANAQKLGLRCAFIDKENMLDPTYAKGLGVDIEKLYLSQPNTGEEALTITEELIDSGAVDVIVIDSIAALNPSADLEKDYDELSKMAGRASMITRFFERNDSKINKNKVLLLCTNQMREQLQMYASGPSVPGGKAIKHAASVRLQLSIDNKESKTLVDSYGVQLGNVVRVKTVKNKLNSPFKESSYNLIFGVGIDKVKDLLDTAVDLGLIEKAASWYVYKDARFQGLNGAREYFTPELLEQLRQEITQIVGPTWGPEGK